MGACVYTVCINCKLSAFSGMKLEELPPDESQRIEAAHMHRRESVSIKTKGGGSYTVNLLDMKRSRGLFSPKQTVERCEYEVAASPVDPPPTRVSKVVQIKSEVFSPFTGHSHDVLSEHFAGGSHTLHDTEEKFRDLLASQIKESKVWAGHFN